MKTKGKLTEHEKAPDKVEVNIRKPGKSAHGRRGGDDDISGGGRQGNAGMEGDRYGSFGGR